MKVTKKQLKQIIKEELEVVLTNEEAGELFGEDIEELLNEKDRKTLNEIQIPGLGYVLRSYRWIKIVLKMLLKVKFIPEQVKPALSTLADASQTFVDAMDTLYKEHPKTYAAIMGPIMAADVAGTTAGKAKEVVLQQIYDKMTTDEESTEIEPIK